jgi:hypothetical protein
MYIFRYSLSCLVLGLTLGVITSKVQAKNLPLIEALLRSQNYSQAERILRNQGRGEGTSLLYHGVITFGQGHHKESLQLLTQAYPAASPVLRRRVLGFMMTAMKVQPPEPAIFFSLYELFHSEVKSSLAWTELFAEYLLETDQSETILEKIADPNSPKLLHIMNQAYERLNQTDKFFERFLRVSMSSPELRLEFIRILLKAKRIQEVRRRFTEVRNQRKIWVADFHLILGTELKDSGLIEAGYRLKISLRPTNFSFYQGLSDLYYRLGKDAEAESILMDYLKRDPNQYKGAREIAQVFIDHGRFQKLLEFISKLRSRLKNPRILYDVVLYTFSILKDFEPFFTELSSIYPKVQGQSWGQKIMDSFQPEDLEKAYTVLCLKFVKIPMLQAEILLTLASKSSSYPGPWADRKFAKFPGSTRIHLAKICLKSGNFQLIPKILAIDLKKESTVAPEVAYLAGSAYARMGKYRQAYPLLIHGLSTTHKSPQIWLDLYRISHRIHFYRKDLEKWYLALIKTPLLKSLSQKHRREVYAIWGEHLLFSKRFGELENFLKSEASNLTQGARQYISAVRYLFQGKIKEGFVFLNTFLNHRVGSPYFTNLQDIYTLLLQFQEVFKESFVTHYLESLRLAHLGQADKIDLSLNLLAKSVSGHWAEHLLADYIQVQRLQANYLRWQSNNEGDLRESQRQNWEEGALKLFEDFPDSIYTPEVVRQLVRHLERLGRVQEARELIRNYLTRSTADLLAQRLRNRLL